MVGTNLDRVGDQAGNHKSPEVAMAKETCPKCRDSALLVLKTRLRPGLRIRYLRCFKCGKRLRRDERLY
jgi:DNA-directed RNA polymerase subunit M/transcription elongation factor TFIIS